MNLLKDFSNPPIIIFWKKLLEINCLIAFPGQAKIALKENLLTENSSDDRERAGNFLKTMNKIPKKLSMKTIFEIITIIIRI